MGEVKPETVVEKSPGDAARETVAKLGYEFLTNYKRSEPPVEGGKKGWLEALRSNDESIEDLVMGKPAFDNEGRQILEMQAAYVKRKPQEK